MWGSKLVVTNFSLKLYNYFSLCLKESGVVFGYPCLLWVPPVFPLGLVLVRRGAWSFPSCAALESAVAVRTGFRFPLVAESSVPAGVSWVGHPCGPIAPLSWLVARPAWSVRVSRFLARDSGVGGLWNRCSFAAELFALEAAGGSLCREARRVVRRWVRAGRPAPWLGFEAGLSLAVCARLTAAQCVACGFVE